MTKQLTTILVFLFLFFIFSGDSGMAVDLNTEKEFQNEKIEVLDNNEKHTLEEYLAQKDIKATKVQKGRKFLVLSKQSLGNKMNYGSKVEFESAYNESFYTDKSPSKILFTGTVVKTGEPKIAGSGGSVKINIDRLKVGQITYPVDAVISKVDKRRVFLGNLTATPAYLNNLVNTANNGTITMNKVYQDPCTYTCSHENVLVRPIYYLGGAILGAADLVLSPLISLFLPGRDLYIPENTYYEIKLDDDLVVLNI